MRLIFASIQHEKKNYLPLHLFELTSYFSSLLNLILMVNFI